MNKNMVMRIATCAAAVVAALPLCATELVHRWSFNGDFADSVGGADAVKCGTYVSLYGNRVHTGYGSCSHGSGYVDLGTNMLDTTAATVEIWARHDGVQKWSRVFDYGADDTHYFYVGYSYGTTLASERVEFYNSANGAKTYQDDTMGANPNGYEIGKEYYVAVTFQKQGDGSTLIRWQRREASTGNLTGAGSMTAANGLHTFVNPVLYLGHSQYVADKDALAAYDEVRLWSGVLTDEQLAASAAAGPDATIEVVSGAPQFAAAVMPEPPAQRAAVPNGGFRLMTYNVQFCYDENNTIIPDRTAARILAENPDFCCVNEVRDSEGHPEATLLAKLTGMHKTFDGNLILSKEEPLGSETVFLKMSKSGYGDRYCLICEFTNFCVAVTHLDTTAKDGDSAEVQASNAVAIATMRDAFAKYTKPVFLCGDWNTRPNWENMDRFNEFLEILSPTNGVRTYHGHSATGGYILDYISVDKAHRDDFYVQRSEVAEDLVTSDHNPVIAELYRRPAASELGWVDEAFLTAGCTGTWNPAIAWDGASWKAELAGEKTFTPMTQSGGNLVTIDVTVAFDVIPDKEVTPSGETQGAAWLGTNGCFQVWTRGECKMESGKCKVAGGEPSWVDVEAEGVTPETGVDYTFRFTFDYATGTYSVCVATTPSSSFIPLRATDGEGAVATQFPLAATGSAISAVAFKGTGLLTSILGEYENVKVSGFRMFVR